VARGIRPISAEIAAFVMIAAGVATIVFGAWAAVSGSNLLGVLLTWALGLIYAYAGLRLRRDESWAWGAGVFGSILYVLLGWLLHWIMLVFTGVAIAVLVLLFDSRAYFGVVRPDPAEEKRARERLRAERTANPDRLHCPRCGSTSLWLAPDGSAYCDSCRAGTISIRPPA